MDVVLEATIRLAIAMGLGGVVGLDRELLEKSAGLRTMILVALGSAMFTLTAERVLGTDPELSKVIAGVAGGIGFLGAGAIIQSRGEVEGMTTAASVWLTAAAGMACGLGEYGVAAPAVIIAILVLRALRPVERVIERWRGRARGDSSPDRHGERDR